MVSEFSFGCMTFNDQGEGGLFGRIGQVQGEQAYELMKVCYEHG